MRKKICNFLIFEHILFLFSKLKNLNKLLLEIQSLLLLLCHVFLFLFLCHFIFLFILVFFAILRVHAYPQ